ncbi:metal ABC transporter permease [Humisphaera borealis]|uniref:Metal ABC transporter permease n=1 Tax=Humisphaera borealis TaxID=2807512 RepID=A0A7M2WQ36_9BACT|nr:iron chelate uptake ABC transporter family permease subunit [Humisphaera borealis]QOV87509.1 metal ABC transporter permease [Humisphaera borealis]
MNPFLWILGSPPDGYKPGLETFWPILVEGALVSVALALIGCWLVVRGLSLLGDALAHSVLPGIVIGFLIGKSLQSAWILVGATAMGMAAAVLVQAVRDNSRVKEDASLGIVFTTLFAIGVVLINLFAGQTDLDPGCVLYGQVEYFIRTPEKIIPMACILGGILLLMVLFFRQLLISTFDPLLARSMGIPATFIHYTIMAVLSLTTVASFEAVGAILAVALLVTPGATARLWTDRMKRMLLLAALHALLATTIGYWLSHPSILNTSASGAISSAGFGLFLVSWLVAPKRGLLSQYRVRRRLRRTMAEENLVKTVHELTSPSPATAANPSSEPQGTETSMPAQVPTSVASARVRELLQMPSFDFEAALRGVISRGWARAGKGQITLTPAGHRRAQLLASAHELWEQYLRQEVGLADDHLHDPAEWVEHFLDESRIEELKASLIKQAPG